jgi:ribonuclease HI
MLKDLGVAPTTVRRYINDIKNRDTTNNRMEMTAAIKALEALKDNANPVYIRSDSNLLIRGMNEWLPGWKAKGRKNAGGKSVANQDLWELLDDLSTPRIHWKWVRGHAGNELNEAVDRLATLAARTPSFTSAAS